MNNYLYMEYCFSIFYSLRLVKKDDVLLVSITILIGALLLIHIHDALGVCRVLKQIALGTLTIASALFPNICFVFQLSVLPDFLAQSGPHRKTELPKARSEKKFLVPLSCGQATLFYNVFFLYNQTPEHALTFILHFCMQLKLWQNLMTEKKQEKKKSLIDDSQLPKEVLEIGVCK